MLAEVDVSVICKNTRLLLFNSFVDSFFAEKTKDIFQAYTFKFLLSFILEI